MLQQILEYDSTDISEETGVNKINASNECDICHYWYFLNIGFKFEPYVCNRCHDIIQKAINFNDVAIVSIKRSDNRNYFQYMRKDDIMNIMKKS